MILSDMLNSTSSIPLYISKDRTLRIKIIDACGMTCTFCHNEGTPVVADNVDRSFGDWTNSGLSGRKSIYAITNGAQFLPAPIFPDEDFAHALSCLNESLGINEVHLTGGEPTLHKDLSSLVKMIRDAGFKVCMTSNGENGSSVLKSCAQAGLDRVNFSIFGTTPLELSHVQHEKYRNKTRAERKIYSLKKSIETALEYGIKASANIVVPDYTHADRVMRLLEEYSPDLSVRLLNSLGDGDISIQAIYRILDDLKAVPVARYVTAGVSGSRVAYKLPSDRIVYFKQIRPVRLPRTCKDCRYNNDTDCQEGYYGIRLYRDRNGTFQVGICIQRMDLCMTLDEFVKSDIPSEILSLCETEYLQLTQSLV